MATSYMQAVLQKTFKEGILCGVMEVQGGGLQDHPWSILIIIPWGADRIPLP